MTFLALQALARSFEDRAARKERELLGLALDLGATALPLCLRELRSADEDRRTWAAELLLALTEIESLRPRIVAALRDAVDAENDDETKVCALAVLAELGEHAASASFRDPQSIHRRSLGELAELL